MDEQGESNRFSGFSAEDEEETKCFHFDMRGSCSELCKDSDNS